MRQPILFFLLVVVICNTGCSSTEKKGEQLYTTYCAGCHGAGMEGTNAGPALYHPDWKHGSSLEEIEQSIANGIQGTTMIGWDKVLNEEQIRDLANYIKKSQKLPPSEKNAIKTEYINTSKYRLKIEKIVDEGLQTPWGIEFINSDSALISEKPGSMKWLINGNLDNNEIKGLPETHLTSSTGGFMDIAFDPDYKNNKWIYLSYSHTNDDIKNKDALALTKIVRGQIIDNIWTNQQTLFEVPDSLMVIRGNRWGCRFLFDREGYLYFSIGDMGKAMDSQQTNKATGKVFRINPDGSIPKDNPFVDVNGALPQTYSIGNRNVQGIAQHPETGEIWATEHGPRGGDELNILHKGANYGWPVITYGINYDGTVITDKTHQEGMEQPIVQWTPSIAVCPAEFCVSPLFPNWKNNLLVGALAFQEIRRLEIENDSITEQELMIKGMGRIRDFKFGPNGALYVLTNDPDCVLRIVPETE
ncbi:PQQ-dependent sugar dehydrogenase [Sunxiuqinia sp. A32]|uniref:PQQ-dependent sugar dehydrogenase n=1 Tax=Sunxiuqinia sp. A32 TaxID=3461496 RepID=UPI0040463FB5